MQDLKRQARTRRRAELRQQRATARALARKRRRCFWAWPLGHEFVDFGTDEPDLRCVACDTPPVATTTSGDHIAVRSQP